MASHVGARAIETSPCWSSARRCPKDRQSPVCASDDLRVQACAAGVNYSEPVAACLRSSGNRSTVAAGWVGDVAGCLTFGEDPAWPRERRWRAEVFRVAMRGEALARYDGRASLRLLGAETKRMLRFKRGRIGSALSLLLWLWSGSCLLDGRAAVCEAQTGGPIRVTTRLVSLDVVVEDGSGHVVTGLDGEGLCRQGEWPRAADCGVRRRYGRVWRVLRSGRNEAVSVLERAGGGARKCGNADPSSIC